MPAFTRETAAAAARRSHAADSGRKLGNGLKQAAELQNLCYQAALGICPPLSRGAKFSREEALALAALVKGFDAMANRIRILRGKPLPGRALSCVNRYRGALMSKTVRTDSNGKASFALGRGGDWLLSLVHMEASKEEGADWRSYWASLSFSLPEATSRR